MLKLQYVEVEEGNEEMPYVFVSVHVYVHVKCNLLHSKATTSVPSLDPWPEREMG